MVRYNDIMHHAGVSPATTHTELFRQVCPPEASEPCSSIHIIRPQQPASQSIRLINHRGELSRSLSPTTKCIAWYVPIVSASTISPRPKPLWPWSCPPIPIATPAFQQNRTSTCCFVRPSQPELVSAKLVVPKTKTTDGICADDVNV
jgi:hypothetical protein